MSSEIGVLRAELDEAQTLLGFLQTTVDSIHTRLSQLERAERSNRGGGASAAGSEAWSVVGETEGSPGQSSQAVDKEDHPGRVALAKRIGRFLARCQRGDNRGSSGRELLNLPNRLYVVLADHSGKKFGEPQIFKDFSRVTAICKKGYSFGESTFVGFATQWEAKTALEEAGLPWTSLQ